MRGTNEPPSATVLSDKLYGRQEALNYLTARAADSQSAPAVVFVEGEAGVGKTALLQAFQHAIAGRSPWVCVGRFDRNNPANPMGGWFSALEALADVLLTKSEAELRSWRRDLWSKLGQWGTVIGTLIPRWQRVLGPRTAVANNHIDEDRLALAIHRLLSCLGSPDTPVILTFDDLHWADASSLRLLELVLTVPEPSNALILASARPESSSSIAHSFESLRQRLDSNGVKTDVLVLKSLDSNDLAQLLADSFKPSIADVEALSRLVHECTGGSPLYVREFLPMIVHRQLLQFNAEEQQWQWDRESIQAMPVTDNVVDLLVRRIERLPRELGEALKVCACLGSTFTLADFVDVTNVLPGVASAWLDELVQSRVIRAAHRRTGSDQGDECKSSSLSYEFSHDRVLEACNLLATTEEKAALHLTIGRSLEARLNETSDDSTWYRAANHFNASRHLVIDASERHRCAQINLVAGTKARSRGGFSQALECLMHGLKFLATDTGSGEPRYESSQIDWTSHPHLVFELHRAAAEAALVNGELEVSHELCAAALDRIPDAILRSSIHEVQISAYKAQKRHCDAVQASREALARLGVKLPSRPNPIHILAGLWTTKRRVLALGVGALVEQPLMQDAKMKAVGRIFHEALPAAYLGQPNLFPLLVFQHVTDSIRHGTDPYLPVSLAGLAAVLCAMGDFENAFRLGDASLRLLDKLGAESLRARVFAPYYFLVFPWRNHIRDSIPFHAQGARSGLECGDLEFACYELTMHSLARFQSGDPLPELLSEFESHRRKILSLRQERSTLLQNIYCQVVWDLRHTLKTSGQMSGPFYDERKMLPRCMDPPDENLIFNHYLGRLILSVMFRDGKAARDVATEGRRYLRGATFGNYLGPVFSFYESLAHLLVAEGERPGRGSLRRVANNQRKLKAWAEHAPMNFLHKYHLVEAQRSSVTGNDARAARFFERAIEDSLEQGFLHEGALAQELAARFYLSRNMSRLGRKCLCECLRAYRVWGADAKVRQLQAEYEQDFAIASANSASPPEVHPLLENLDYQTILRSAQAISGEILLPRLLETLLETILEHAAAQRGVLILEERGELFVEAWQDREAGDSALLEHEPVEGSSRLPVSLVLYVARTEGAVVLDDAGSKGLFVQDPYVRERRPKSVMCVPILRSGRLLGLIYLESNRLTHLFTHSKLEIIELLASQAAISISNARFHKMQLEAQQAKINPHFLFNALSSIAELAVSDADTAEVAILALSDLYRYILASSADRLVTLEQELAIVKQYLTLEKLRFRSRLEFSVTASGDTKGVTLPGLLIQPLVENCIQHAIAPRLHTGHVTVHAQVKDRFCCITVADDGDGIPHETAGTGFGLRSVQERLALVYGQDYSFAISSSDGYVVEIEIPCEHQETRA